MGGMGNHASIPANVHRVLLAIINYYDESIGKDVRHELAVYDAVNHTETNTAIVAAGIRAVCESMACGDRIDANDPLTRMALWALDAALNFNMTMDRWLERRFGADDSNGVSALLAMMPSV